MNPQIEDANNEDYEELDNLPPRKSRTNLAKTGGFTPATEQHVERSFRRSQVNMSSGKHKYSAARTSTKEQFQQANQSNAFESIGS